MGSESSYYLQMTLKLLFLIIIPTSRLICLFHLVSNCCILFNVLFRFFPFMLLFIWTLFAKIFYIDVQAGNKALTFLYWYSLFLGKITSVPEQQSEYLKETLIWYFFFFFCHRFVSRLYWFPLKVIYTTVVVSIYRTLNKTLHLYILFNIFLWILLDLNIEWFLMSLVCSTNIIFYSWLEFSWFSKWDDVREYEQEKM